MSTKYKFDDHEGIYFISMAVAYWIGVLARRDYKDMLIDSLNHCIRKKELIVYAHELMSNPIHLLISR